MSVSTARPPIAAPRRLRVPRNNVQRERGESVTSSTLITSRPEAARRLQAAQSRPSKCSDPTCVKPKIVFDDNTNQYVCETCGAAALDEPIIVSEVTFGETLAGAPAVQGSYVGQGQTHGRTRRGPGFRVAGRDTFDTREQTNEKVKAFFRRLYNNLSTKCRVLERYNIPAFGLFQLAVKNSFYVQGRSIESVAAVAYYLQCRRERGENDVMLIDIAEILDLSVFTLGKMYTEMIKAIYGTTEGIAYDTQIELINPENLIKRFAQDLELGEKRHRVVKDAIRLVQRMDRDWLVTGRRPAGICAAALILASRMNNLRRTVREVVLAAKVAEITINKRLEEFGCTDSSKLSVDEFRNTMLPHSHDPPSYYKAHNPPKPKKGRKRKGVPETTAEIEGDGEGDHDPSTVNSKHTQKRPRYDAQGFAIPELPIDPAIRHSGGHTAGSSQELVIDPKLTSAVNQAVAEENAISQKTGTEPGPSQTPQTENNSRLSDEPIVDQPRRGRGRPRGAKNWQPPPISQAEQALEEEIGNDVDWALQNSSLNSASRELSKLHARASASPEPSRVSRSTPGKGMPPEQRSPPRSSPQSSPASVSVVTLPSGPQNPQWIAPDESGENLTDLDGDPEVAGAVLTATEISIKERIWVADNADWMRKNHVRKVKRDLQIAADREAGVDVNAPDYVPGGKKKKGGKSGRGRIGDVSYLDRLDKQQQLEHGQAREGNQTADGQTAEEPRRERSYSEAMQGMLLHRGKFSKRLNQDVMSTLLGDEDDSQSATSEERRPGRSTAGSEATSRERSVEIVGSAELAKAASAAESSASASTTISKPKVISGLPVAITEPGKPTSTSQATWPSPPGSSVWRPSSRDPTRPYRGRAPGGQAGFEKREAKRQARAAAEEGTLRAEQRTLQEWDDEEEQEGGSLEEARGEERSWMPRRLSTEALEYGVGVGAAKAPEGRTVSTAVRIGTLTAPDPMDMDRTGQFLEFKVAPSIQALSKSPSRGLTPRFASRSGTPGLRRSRSRSVSVTSTSPLSTPAPGSAEMPRINSPIQQPRTVAQQAELGQEEIVGPIETSASSPLSSLPSHIGSATHVFGDDEESLGDEDDYIAHEEAEQPEDEDDIEAAFAGRFKPPAWDDDGDDGEDGE